MLLQRGPSISDLRMIVIWIGGQIWVEWALQDVTCTRGILQLAVLVVLVLVLVVTPFLISLFFLSFFGSGPWIQSWSHLRTKPDTLKRKHENACNCLMAPSSSTPWDVPRLFTCSSCLSPLQGKVHHLSARVHQLQWNKQIGPRDILHQEGPAVKLVYIMQLCVCLYLLAFLLPFLSLSIRNIANNVNIQRYYYSHLKNDCGSTREKVLEVLHQPWQCYSRKTDSDVSASVIW